MDREVAKTLAELERKLHDLERTLASLGSEERGSAPRPASAPPEATFAQPSPPSPGPRSPSHPSPSTPPSDPAHSGFLPREGGSAHVGARSSYRSPEQAARVVDEGGRSQEETADASARPDAIELSELDRFRRRLAHTFDDLVEEYSRIIALRRTSPRPPDPSGSDQRSH